MIVGTVLLAAGTVVTSAVCKTHLAALSAQHPNELRRFFGTEATDDPELERSIAQAAAPRHWARISKERADSGMVVREFDCRPFESQVRGIVTSQITPQGVALGLVIQGE